MGVSVCVYGYVFVVVDVRVCLNAVGEMATGIMSNVEAGLQDEEAVKQMDEFD